jgi:glycerophosphoryl diester phosphodiesterase
MASFGLAAEMGAHGVELDAKLSADGEVVVIHDATVDRTTTGSGRVDQLTLAQLRELDAGAYFSARQAGERIPTLDEVFAAYGRQLLINVELTNYARIFDHLPEAVVELVRRHKLEERVLLSSFNPVALLRARRLAPYLPQGLLLHPGEPAWARWALSRLMRYEALHLEERLVAAKILERVHRRDKRLNVWTVNDETRMRALLQMGVDGVITDLPEVAKGIVDAL